MREVGAAATQFLAQETSQLPIAGIVILWLAESPVYSCM